MTENLIIPFDITGIDTRQFALIEDNYDNKGSIDLQVGVNVGASDENHAVSIFFEVRFLSNQHPFILLEFVCQFEVDQSKYNGFISTDKTIITIPKRLCLHLGTITVGTARGILYEKLKDTIFRDFILPTIDLREYISEDVTLSKNV